MGIGAGAGAAIAGGLGAVGSVASGLMKSGGSQQAASTNQAALAAEQAMAQPYASMGQTTGNELVSELQGGQLGQPAPTDMSAIANMPGYQFNLQQGLLGTQNAAAAHGLGVSGAALMGAANYSTGLSNMNFQNYFNDYWSNQNNRFNMLNALTTTGANAAVGAGSNVANTSSNIGQAQQGAASATASGVSGASNSLANALTTYFGSQNTGSTISPSTNASNASYQSGAFSSQPSGTYGPFA